MPVFISYSHVDKDIVDKIAISLVKERVNVWIDRWELNVGDSIVQKVQTALGESDALLVVLSKASVDSEWCKKELSAGQIREIEEKRIILLPVVVEKCERPLLLRDKLYADLTTNFEEGMGKILEAISKVISIGRGRIPSALGFIDWGISVEATADAYSLLITFVQHSPPADGFVIVGSVSLQIGGKLKEKYEAYCREKLEWVARKYYVELLAGVTNQMKYSVLLKDATQVTNILEVQDRGSSSKVVATIKMQWLGTDTGKDVVVHLDGVLRDIAESNSRHDRSLTSSETSAVLRITQM